MAPNDEDKYDKKHDEDEQDGSSETGASGQIEFHDFLNAGEIRELPPAQVKHLLAVHIDVNKASVTKQMERRRELAALKAGKIALETYRQSKEAGMGMQAGFKSHPTLSNKAQFSGVDRQVSVVPGEVADTNNEKRKELQLNYDLRHNLRNQPQHTFTPRLTPKGG